MRYASYNSPRPFIALSFCISVVIAVYGYSKFPTDACANSGKVVVFIDRNPEMANAIAKLIFGSWKTLWDGKDPFCLTFKTIRFHPESFTNGGLSLREAIGEKFDILVAGEAKIARAVIETFPKTPVVFVSGPDPARSGLVESLIRPGRNATGYMTLLPCHAKRMELLQDLVPGIRTIGVVVDDSWLYTWEGQPAFLEALRPLGWKSKELVLPRGIPFSDVARQLRALDVDVWYLPESLVLHEHEASFVAWMRQSRKPAMYSWPRAVISGGLVAVNEGPLEVVNSMPILFAQILSGRDPGTIPISKPVATEMYLNGTTAKELGLKPTPAMLRRFTRIYE